MFIVLSLLKYGGLQMLMVQYAKESWLSAQTYELYGRHYG